MKKYTSIILAAVLILLGILTYRSNRPRALSQCFPEGTWESASVQSFAPVPGETGEVFTLSVTPEELQKAAQEVTVFRRPKINSWTCGNVSLHIQIGEKTMLAEIGEDGSIAICDAADLDSWTYWRAPDGKLYQMIT